jgi:ornithine decarboxylase
MTADGGRRYAAIFADQQLATPCLLIDLDVIASRYRQLHATLPQAEIFYAVKANPHPAVIDTLAALGSSFDAASKAEIDLCLDRGIAASAISYGNTIKSDTDISHAYRRGIRMFAFDSECELRKIARHAPGAVVFCRILVSSEGAQWPLSRKFGCVPSMAVELLSLAAELGLKPHGVSFHVGSQQRDPTRWEDGISLAAAIYAELRKRNITPSLINLGGGFPASYDREVPAISEYAKVIDHALCRAFAGQLDRVIVEPGRFVAGDAGVLRASVVLISQKSYDDDHRWVYLDVGRFSGLAETENESIRYPITTSPDRPGEVGPVILAGPTCDSVDILYQQTPYYLAADLRVGDYVDFLSAGAYTATCSSVGFNGFPPLPTYVFGEAK